MIKLNDILINTKWGKYVAAILSGGLTSLALVFPNTFFITYISLVPLFYVLFLSKHSALKCFKLFLTYGIIYYLIIYNWFFSLEPLEAQSYSFFKYIVAAIWLLVSLIQALQISFVGLLFKFAGGKKIYKALSLPFVWVIIEWLQEQTLWGFPWGRLALSQYNFTAALQSASLFGSFFVSFLIVLVNSLIAYAITIKADKKLFRTVIISSILIFLLNATFGYIRINVLNNRQYETVSVAGIQGNLPSDEKWENGGYTSFEIYMEYSKQAAEDGAKIILWPETAVPVYLEKDDFYDNTYKEFADDYDVYLIVGGFALIDENNYSVLVMYTPEGESNIENPYKKRHLVPFGEYVPYRDFIIKLLPFMGDFRKLGDDLTPASDTVLFDTEYGDMSGLICFDSIFSRLSRNDVKNGSELILIGTNDSYYMESVNPYQHNGQAVLRAVENGRYVVRAANTGISSIISSNGSILKQTNINERIILSYDVPFINNKTLYNVIGDVFVIISAAMCIFIFIISKRKKK